MFHRAPLGRTESISSGKSDTEPQKSLSYANLELTYRSADGIVEEGFGQESFNAGLL